MADGVFEHDERLLVLSARLRSLSRRYGDRELHRSVMARVGLDLDQAAAITLVQLLESAPIRSTDLAAALRIDPSTASRHVAALARLRYVARQADHKDGRASLLVLTDAGADAAKRLLDGWLEFNGLLLAEMSPEDVDRLIELVDLLLTQYERAASIIRAH